MMKHEGGRLLVICPLRQKIAASSPEEYDRVRLRLSHLMVKGYSPINLLPAIYI